VTSWFRRETVTRQRPTRVDDGHGNLIDDWTDPDEAPIAGCLVAPSDPGVGTGSEDETAGDTVWTYLTVYGPPTADVTATDAVVVRGDRYAIVGVPAQWPAGVVISLRRSEG
jgi:hypothetical protein